MGILISVILPVYNSEKYLRECLDSILKQTFTAYEVICINDGSTDSSLDILQDYSLKDERIKVYSQKNAGAGAARNFGMSLAKGEYLLFVDSDDFFDKDMLKESYDKAIQDEAEICIFMSKQYDEHTKDTKECTYSVRTEYLPNNRPFAFDDIKSNPFKAIMGWAWDKLYKKSFVLNNDLKFQEQRTTNDMYFVFASLINANRITIVDKFLYYQRRNVEGSLSATRNKSWECFYFALLKVKQELIDKGIYETQKRNFVNYALHSCLWNLNTLDAGCADLLRDNLMNGWFDNLDIRDYKDDFYLNDAEYSQLCNILYSDNEK